MPAWATRATLTVNNCQVEIATPRHVDGTTGIPGGRNGSTRQGVKKEGEKIIDGMKVVNHFSEIGPNSLH